MKKTIMVFLPFAYGGNPASESGPKCVKVELEKRDLLLNESIQITQEFSESAEEYLKRVQKIIKQIYNLYEKIIIFGGNHLSIFPIYEIIYSKQGRIITLDAHRDFYPKQDVNHATFMNKLNSEKCEHLLLGARDYEKHRNKHPNIIVNTTLNGEYINKKIDLLDIDLDVLDPKIFSCCGSVIENGFSIEDVKYYIEYAKERKCKIYSFSEYIPNYDKDMLCADIIISFVKMILEK